MQLTKSNLLRYLVERELVPAPAALRRFVAVGATSRHRHFRVWSDGDLAFFVKQSMTFDPVSTAFVRTEAICYFVAARLEQGSPLRAYLPRYRVFDPVRHVLVVDLVEGAKSMNDAQLAHPALAQRAAATVGKALRRVHEQSIALAEDPEVRAAFAVQAPPTFGILLGPPESITGWGRGNVELLKTIQGMAEITSAIRELGTGWTSSCLVHGDMRLANVLVPWTDAPEAEPASCTFVDWECAQWGDPAWDVGGMLQSLVALALLAHLNPGASPVTVDAVRASLLAFWESYVLGMAASARRAFLAAVIRCAAVRTVQTALECGLGADAAPSDALQLCAYAASMLKTPAKFAAGWGLDAS
jgi:hypothetical protein